MERGRKITRSSPPPRNFLHRMSTLDWNFQQIVNNFFKLSSKSGLCPRTPAEIFSVSFMKIIFKNRPTEPMYSKFSFCFENCSHQSWDFPLEPPPEIWIISSWIFKIFISLSEFLIFQKFSPAVPHTYCVAIQAYLLDFHKKISPIHWHCYNAYPLFVFKL